MAKREKVENENRRSWVGLGTLNLPVLFKPLRVSTSGNFQIRSELALAARTVFGPVLH